MLTSEALQLLPLEIYHYFQQTGKPVAIQKGQYLFQEGMPHAHIYLMMHGKKGALFSTLIRLANTYGETALQGITIDFPLSNTEIANCCGTIQEVVNRLLNDLKIQRFISFEQGMITIHNLHLPD